MGVRAILDSSIKIPDHELDPDVWAQMVPLLTIPNWEKEDAKRAKRYGWWDMEDNVDLYDFYDGHVVIPRGFRDPLIQGFKALGVEVEWDDRRTTDREFKVWPPFSLRPHQGPMADAILTHEEGIAEAPAGSGKTVGVLEVIRRARERCNLVIVNEIGIARQWIEDEAMRWLGPDYGYGLIGGGDWSESRLTVATLQTLYARMQDLDESRWWERWGLVCLDECHHQTARTFLEVMQRFPARLRFGVSATPDKTGEFQVAMGVLGDVIHRTTRHELRDHGILMKPTIEVIDTDFYHDYWPDHSVNAFEFCEVPHCPKNGKRHGHRNNYQKCLAALVADQKRNDLIASKIIQYSDRRQIVVSKQTKQLQFIRDALTRAGFKGEIVWLVGDTTEEQRRQAKAIMGERPAVLLTTIADEAFNVPALDVLHMPFPTKNPGAIRQRVGRVERYLKGKLDPIVLDYRDRLVGPFSNQFRNRKLEVYVPEMYRVVFNRQEVAA